MESRPPKSKTPAFAEYPIEFVLDEEGYRIRDPESGFGWKVTEESLENRRKWAAEHYKGTEPIEILNRAYFLDPHDQSKVPRLMYYGLGVKTKQLVDYAKQHKLVAYDENKFNVYTEALLMRATNRHLQQLCRTDLTLETPYCESAQWVITLHTNHNWFVQELADPNDIRKVIKTIQTELQLEQPAMWYYAA
ncbi:hypothetical protein EVG20_g9330 [Dentipellis fragilis]|uniref:Uncharacterized protein n=1 Tax=Dentipellis fragilis TaxID=205917 RepID=A0A4Y9Y102_9AGAM|nr:hypothetical protein EVG20_g9330 [Dentipellis fragilis]